MGQYHYTVSMDANEYLDPHYLGAGLKEWEQMGGCFPSALAFLLSHNPGNMPADVGHHPMAIVERIRNMIEPLDITGKIGPLYPETIPNPCDWPMYSFHRPAHLLWGAIAAELHRRGWKEHEIRIWLQSKETRWALDGKLGDLIRLIGELYAANCQKVK